MRILLALVAITFLAGCAAKTPDQIDVATTPTDVANGSPALPVASAPVTQAFVVDGQTRTGVCVLTPAATECQYPLMGHDDFKILDFTGNATLLNGTLTWTATTPATANMNAYMLFGRDGGYYWNPDSPIASGANPLAISFDLTPFGDQAWAVGFSNTNGAGDAGVFVGYNVQQDFHFDGSFTYVPTA